LLEFAKITAKILVCAHVPVERFIKNTVCFTHNDKTIGDIKYLGKTSMSSLALDDEWAISIREAFRMNVALTKIGNNANTFGLSEFIANTCNYYTNGIELYDQSGKCYTFPRVTIEEVDAILRIAIFKYTLSYKVSLTELIDNNHRCLYEIISKLQSWKYCQSGIALMLDGKQKVLLDISTLLSKKMYQEMSKKKLLSREFKNFGNLIMS
jgi:hypothetical protein